MGDAVRITDDAGVRTMTLCRPVEYNTITPQLRDELADAIDSAQHDDSIRVLLLNAEGPAFCAGYDLGWATGEQADDEQAENSRAWDSASDLHMIGEFAATWAKLHDSIKPTIA
ncbi:MAG: enoyl-CoA hydratase/isomerase family protein, partial [Ilumatobacteraceae bacterium]